MRNKIAKVSSKCNSSYLGQAMAINWKYGKSIVTSLLYILSIIVLKTASHLLGMHVFIGSKNGEKKTKNIIEYYKVVCHFAIK